MTGVSPAPTRARLEADERRGLIVEAAQRLFAERSYEAVSTSDIAAAAGTTRTNVHYYFRSKRDLFLEVVEQFSRIPADLEVPVKAHGSSLEEQLGWMFGRWLDAVERNQRMFTTMVRATSSNDPVVSGVLANSTRAWEKKLLVIVGMDPGDVAHQAMIRSFQAMVADATQAWLHTGSMTKSQVHALLVHALIAVSLAASETG